MPEVKRIKYGNRELELPAGMTLEDAKQQMARFFPELSEAKVETKKDGDTTIYVFSKQAGRKGASDFICLTCGEIKLFNTHQCPPRWQYCLGDYGDDWRDIYAQDEEHAATKAAEKIWDSDWGNEIHIWIRKPDEMTATLYPVTVEAVPEFSVPYLYGDQKRKTRVIDPEAAEETEEA
jgi:hypothetical protein